MGTDGRGAEASDSSSFIQGDVNCVEGASSADALAIFTHAAGVQTSGALVAACPIIGDSIIGDQPWGDTNCDGVVNGEDAIPILRFLGELPQEISGCAPVGAQVSGVVPCETAGWAVTVGDGDWECQSGTSARISVTSGEHMVLRNEVLADAVIEADVSTLNREASLVMRAQDGDNAYVVVFIPEGTAFPAAVLLLRKVAGSYVLLANAPLPEPVQTGEGAHLSVQMIGSQMQVRFNGEMIIDVSDPTFASGKVGLRAFADNQGSCDAFWETRNYYDVEP
jgi:hypothetical protein